MKKLTLFVLIPAVALLVSCSNSNGRQTFDESETDSGTEQLDDNGEQDDYSGDPCDPNPCPGIKHSTGRCTPEEKGRFRCSCEKGYDWYLNSCETELPECSAESKTPCKDSKSNLMWSTKSPKDLSWDDAAAYCENLKEGGHKDWIMPSISMLRTLIRECSNTLPDGTCEVGDTCRQPLCSVAENCSCAFNTDGKYSKFGDKDILWSSTTIMDGSNKTWIVIFTNAQINIGDKMINGNTVRCVRTPKQRADCDELPYENTERNTASSIEQRWNGNEWLPATTELYSEEATDKECRFKCKEGYEWFADEKRCIPYEDPETGLIWSKKSDPIAWLSAKLYCENMNRGNESGWRLPTISELRTLVRNCENTMPEGPCEISDSSLDKEHRDEESCKGCTSSETVVYSRFGDKFSLWSSSEVENVEEADVAWYVNFYNASINYASVSKADSQVFTRCVREKTE